MAEGFLARWSQRKQDLAAGRPLAEPAPPPVAPRAGAQGPATPVAGMPPAVVQQCSDSTVASPAAPADAPAPPVLADVQRLTPESDFRPFLARSVAPEVRNAAMKKLFADPHFNIMDRLDTYIDDYSLPDPMPESMLRQLVSGKFLNLFQEQPPEAGAGDDANGPAGQSVASSTPSIAPTAPTQPPTELAAELPAELPAATDKDHAHTDLRLQQDHAAGAKGPGSGAR